MPILDTCICTGCALVCGVQKGVQKDAQCQFNVYACQECKRNQATLATSGRLVNLRRGA
jgi:hypothetical protein